MDPRLCIALEKEICKAKGIPFIEDISRTA